MSNPSEGGRAAQAPWATLAFGPLAGALIGLLDALIGLFRTGADLSTGSGAGYFTAAISAGALSGALFGVLAFGVQKVVGTLPTRVRRLAASLAVLCILLYLNQDLFAGGSISKNPLVDLYRILAILSGAALSWTSVACIHRVAMAQSGRAVAIFLLFLTSMALLVTNAGLYQGQYSAIHKQEVLCALGAMLLGILILTRDRMRAARSTDAPVLLAVAIVLITPPLFLRESLNFKLGLAALATRGEAAQELLLLPARESGLIQAPPEATADDSLLAALERRENDQASRDLIATLRARGPLDILLVTMDTVRADVTGYSGLTPSVTPVLDRLAEQSVVFERAYTPYPTSAWAYSAILNGVHARTTPITGIMTHQDWPFPEDHSLAGLFSGNGYWTWAISAFNRETLGDRAYFGHLKDGFDVFNPDQRISNSDATEVTDSALAVLRASASRSRLGFVHYMDAHHPYRQPPPKGHSGKMGSYLGEVAYNDGELGRLLDSIDLERTILIVFSDHGEEFFEHGGSFHNSSLYEEQTRVPLLFRIPGVAPRRVREPVNLIDLLPTLVELAGLEDRHPRDGRSLVPFISGSARSGQGYSYSELFRFFQRRLNSGHRAVWRGDLKLIRRLDVGTVELYDLARDPGERTNLLGQRPEAEMELLGLMAALDRRIDGRLRDDARPVENPESPNVFRARTRSLLATLFKGGPDAAVAASELEFHLFDYYADPHPATLRAYGRTELEAIFREALNGMERNDHQAFNRILYLIGNARMQTLLPELRNLWREKTKFTALPLAISLALLGDASGQAPLKQVMAIPQDSILPAVAVALGALGDQSGFHWLVLNLVAGFRSEWATTMKVLPRTGLPDPTRLITERLIHTVSYPEGIARAAITAVREDKSENATALLLRFAIRTWPRARADARALLEERLEAPVLEQELLKATQIYQGDLLARGSEYVGSVKSYREALDGSVLFRTAARMRLAQVLRLDKRPEAARQVLAEVAAKAPEHWYREAAERQLTFVDDPVKIPPDRFGATILEVTRAPPPGLGRAQIFSTTLLIKNTGSIAWTGGPSRFGVALKILFEKPDGELIEGQHEMLNWLPLTGVWVGETVHVTVAARTPGDAGSYKAVLVLHQDWSKLPNKGVIHRF